MPYYANSTYKSPTILKNGHVSTIYAGAIRRTKVPDYQREKWILPDNDFLLVDTLIKDSEKALILCHGLEGDSRCSYNNSAAQYFLQRDYSIFAWNNRSCGGQMNKLPQLYHHASIDDLEFVVHEILARGFKQVYLLGFSLGGAQILSYFGRKTIPKEVKSGVAVSTPIQLKSSAQQISKGFSRVYSQRFIKKIRDKVIVKANTFPELLNKKSAENIRSFEDLAKVFVVPVHGFSGLEDYYTKASPGYSLSQIKTPALILNALNDPMMGAPDYPIQLAQQSEWLYLETPKYGGHCAFPLQKVNSSFADVRAESFFEEFS